MPLPSPGDTGQLSGDLTDPGLPLSPIVGTSPSGDPYLYDDLTSGELALYKQYTDYLDQVDFFNQDTRTKLEYHYEMDQVLHGYDDEEREEKIAKEYSRLEMPKRSYEIWRSLSQDGVRPWTRELWEAPSLEEEKYVSPSGQAYLAGREKFTKGASWMWDTLDATGLTRILMMYMAGMPIEISKSMAVSTASYGMLQRIAGRQDAMSRSISDLHDVVWGAPKYTGEHYKSLYTQLNDQAKRRGIIKGDWTLRLSRNMPLKERWRRLYITLLAYIEKYEERQKTR